MSAPLEDDFGAFIAETEAHRQHRRWFVDFKTTMAVADSAVDCDVIDISPSGACVEPESPQELGFGDEVAFQLPGFGSIPAQVRHNAEGYLGLMFLHDEEDEIAVGRYLVAVEENRPPAGTSQPQTPASNQSSTVAPPASLTADLISAGRQAYRDELQRQAQIAAGEKPTPPITTKTSNTSLNPQEEELTGGTFMQDIEELEARARKAAQTLANRKKRESDLRNTVEQLKSEAEQLRAEVQRLASEADAAIKDKTGLLEENQQLRADNRRLNESSGQHLDEFERLRTEVEKLRDDRERVAVLMDALVTQIELNLQEEAEKSANQDAAADTGDPGVGADPSQTQDVSDSENLSFISDRRGRSRRDAADEVSDEEARSLLKSLRERM